MSFLSDYRHFTSDNEAPEVFHFWSALSALSSVISRRVSLSLGYMKVYPNIYAILVGNAGVRKTTAMDIAREMVMDWKDIPFSAECITKQALCQDMMLNAGRNYTNEKGEIVQYTPYSIYATEMSHFIGVDPIGMVDFLTTVYDRKIYDTKTKNKGSEYIIGPYVTLLGCTTPDWMRAWMKDEIMTGGFLRRALIVFFNGEGKRVAIPHVSESMWEARARCIEWGEKLKQVHGEFVLTPEAMQFYKTWYESRPIPRNVPSEGYHQSKHIQMFKIAMLLALAERHDQLILEKRHLEAALLQLELLEPGMEKVLEGTGRNVLNSVAAKVMDILEAAPGPVNEREVRLLINQHATVAEQLEVLKHLEDTGRLVVVKQDLKNGKSRRLLCTTEKWEELQSRLRPESSGRPQESGLDQESSPD
jgi:hypothetical protein